MNVSKSPGQNWRGILAVFLIYFYFLQFSQFTLLHLLEDRVEGDMRIKVVLGAMTVCGIAGSVLAVHLRRRLLSWKVYIPGFLACALVALVSPFAAGQAAFILLAGTMGLAMGLLTVTTAGLLPLLLGKDRRGLSLGLGTGLAYAMSNLPVLFSSPAEVRSIACGLVLLAGAPVFLPRNLGASGDLDLPEEPHPEGLSIRFRWPWVVTGFLLLVWLDSALFYIIQETRELKSMSWSGDLRLYLNAGVHLLAALVAGHALDRGMRILLVPVAWLGLAAGAVGLQVLQMPSLTLFYVCGVSLYSCMLVYFPSSGAGVAGDPASFKRAATIFAVAGWAGSAFGIGMAENLSAVPMAFLVISGLLLVPVVAFARQRS